MQNAWPDLDAFLWRELGIDTTDGWRDLPPIGADDHDG